MSMKLKQIAARAFLKWKSWERLSWLAGIIAALVAVIALIIQVTDSHSPPEKPAAPDIPGQWNLLKAKSIATKLLASHNWPAAHKNDYSYKVGQISEFVGEYAIIYHDSISKVIAYLTNPKDGGAHTCQSSYSFFEFSRRDDGWRLIHSDLDAIQAGQFCETLEFQKDDDNYRPVNVYAIGDNVYGVEIFDYFQQGGRASSTLSLYARLGDAFDSVLSVECTVDTDEDPCKAGMSIQPGKISTGLADLSVETFYKGSKYLYFDKSSYRFNGQKYIINGDIYRCRANVSNERCQHVAAPVDDSQDDAAT